VAFVFGGILPSGGAFRFFFFEFGDLEKVQLVIRTMYSRIADRWTMLKYRKTTVY
jgi:hypothetical protein